MNYCIGNGQMNQIQMSHRVGALNCMHDQQIILGGGTKLNEPTNNEERKGGDGMNDVSTVVRRLTPL